MPLVNAKCTNCGAPLQVDNSHEAAVCPYCNSAYIVEKAIQNFNFSVTNNITAQNVIIAGKGEMEKERLLQNAKTQLSFNDTASARSTYSQITEDYPDDYRGWYGLASVETDEFKKVDVSAQEFTTICGYMDRAIMTAPSGKKEEIQEEWKKYLSAHWSFLEGKKNELADLESQRNNINNKINSSRGIINNNQTDNMSATAKHIPILLLSIIVFASEIISFPLYNTHALNSQRTIIICLDILSAAPFVVFLLKALFGNSNAKAKDRTKPIFIILLVSAIIRAGYGCFCIAENEMELGLFPLVYSIILLVLAIATKAKASITKKAHINSQNTINAELNNISNFNQDAFSLNGKISDMKNRYNI